MPECDLGMPACYTAASQRLIHRMPEQILSPPSPTTASSEPDVIQAHIAEYEALMARCNYFIALHVGLWGAVVAVAVGAAQVWVVTQSPTVVWLPVAGIQALLQIWSE